MQGCTITERRRFEEIVLCQNQNNRQEKGTTKQTFILLDYRTSQGKGKNLVNKIFLKCK